MFGDRSDDRLVRPFHTFTFAQALQSNLIVDVLKNYISVPANLIIQEAEHAEGEQKAGRGRSCSSAPTHVNSQPSNSPMGSGQRNTSSQMRPSTCHF